jgi:hypothetical protein
VEEQVDRALEKCFTTKVRNINRTQARAKVAAKPAVPAKPAVATAPKPAVAAAPAAKPVAAAVAKPAAVNGVINGSANGNGKPAVATKAPVVAKTVVTPKMKAAAVPPLVGRRTAARAS